MKSDPKKLLKKHNELIQSDVMKVKSHVQRNTEKWVLNTLMIDGYDVPFKYKSSKLYKSLQGQRVNLTYYAETESVAGIEFEVMRVIRVKIT